MLSTRAWGVAWSGSNTTVAELVIRFTTADDTPLVCSSALCTRPTHAAQCMPVTAIFTVRSSQYASVLGVAEPAAGSPVSLPSAEARRGPYCATPSYCDA